MIVSHRNIVTYHTALDEWMMVNSEIEGCRQNVSFKVVPLGSDAFASTHKALGSIPGNYFPIPPITFAVTSLVLPLSSSFHNTF
jgi:hypothetical protein